MAVVCITIVLDTADRKEMDLAWVRSMMAPGECIALKVGD